MRTLRAIPDALRSAFARKAGLLRVLALAVSVLALTVATPNAAEACGITDPLSCVAMIFVKIFQLLTALMGWILVLEVEAVIRVAGYFNFVSPGPSAVQIGWVVTRDVANMFFIVILLIIAFGTILGSSTYHYSKNLPRLLIMAVVINFSKTICGIFIDMGQVIMLTFVNGFKEAAAGNFMNAFQINKLLALGNTQGSYTFGMVIAMMFAFILAAVAVSVTLVLLITLLFRVVMLWVLIILSPIAFLASAVPKGGDYYGQWWKEFKAQIIKGPIIAFFLWLALASVQEVGPGGFASQGFRPHAEFAGQGEAAAAAGASADTKIPTEAGTADTIMNMVIAICILFAGLKFSQEMGGIGTGTAESIRRRTTKLARGVATGGLKYAATPLMTGGGRILAKVPLVGGLGRAAALTGEKWKGERRAAVERFAGTPEDMARLSPGAFARKVGGLKDPKEIDRFLKAGASNPAAMAALTATTESINPLTGERTKKSAGKDALMNLISAGKGADAAKLMTSDRRFTDMAKADPELLKTAYGGLRDAAAKDPNLVKDVAAFETKFVVPLQKNNLFSNIQSVADEKLKSLAPKMSTEDIAALDDSGVELMAKHMTGGQLKKVMQDGKPDQLSGVSAALSGMPPDAMRKFLTDKNIGANDIPAAWYGNGDMADFVLDRTKGDAKARGEAMAKGGGALSARADARLASAMDAGDADKVLASLPDAVNVGSLTADKILGDPKIQGFVDNNPGKIDLASLARNNAPATREAAQALAASVIKADPERAGRMKGEMYQDIRPSKAMQERASGGEKRAEVMEALGGFTSALSEAKKELDALEALATAPGQATAGSQAAFSQLQRAIENLERAGAANASAQKEKTAIEVRIKNTPAGDAAGTAALKKSLGEIEKTLEKTQQEIIKGMSALKGGGKA